MQTLFRLLALTTLLAVPQAVQANCNCICPVYYMGPQGGGHFYYALRYVNATNCNQGTPVGWVGDNPNEQGNCVPPADCTDCIPLGGDARKPGARLQPEPDPVTSQPADAVPTQPVAFQVVGENFTEVEVPIKPGRKFVPKLRAGMGETATQLGAPIILKVCKTADCSDAKYVKIFAYLITREGAGGRQLATVMHFGFECETPAETNRFIAGAGILPMEAFHGKEAAAKPVDGYVTLLLGTIQVPVKVSTITP